MECLLFLAALISINLHKLFLHKIDFLHNYSHKETFIDFRGHTYTPFFPLNSQNSLYYMYYMYFTITFVPNMLMMLWHHKTPFPSSIFMDITNLTSLAPL